MDKPINKIENRIYEIDRTIKNIRVDITTIKADLKIIKDAIDGKELDAGKHIQRKHKSY
jgi:uncharacterized protein (UPF0335 family)